MTQQARRWGSFEFRPETLAKFKAVLERDFGKPLRWNDDQIKAVAYNVLHLLDILTGDSSDLPEGHDKGRGSNSLLLYS